MIKVIASVTNDLSTDQRLHKVCSTLTDEGYDVLLVGRLLRDSPDITRSYNTRRVRLLFNHGALFYAVFNLRLFFLLLFTKSDILVANDLDTLLPNYLVSKIKGIPLIYDTHEYFCGMPEFKDRPFVRSVWKGIESSIFPKLKYIFTVNDSVADLYRKEYGKDIIVVKNFPITMDAKSIKTRDELGLPSSTKIIIYQGAVNVARGLEEVIAAMKWVENAVLIIIGGGNAFQRIKRLVDQETGNNIVLKGSLPFDELLHFTRNADIGLAIEKDDSVNYKYSLSNKVFDYISAGIPVLSSRLIENERLLNAWEVGTFIENHEPKHIAEQINFMLSEEAPNGKWQTNLLKAKKELSWESQKTKLLSQYEASLQR